MAVWRAYQYTLDRSGNFQTYQTSKYVTQTIELKLIGDKIFEYFTGIRATVLEKKEKVIWPYG